jgi:hypothetical protein
MSRPPQGARIEFRWRRRPTAAWHAGYVNHVGDEKIRIGYWPDDPLGGPTVAMGDIEWREMPG